MFIVYIVQLSRIRPGYYTPAREPKTFIFPASASNKVRKLIKRVQRTYMYICMYTRGGGYLDAITRGAAAHPAADGNFLARAAAGLDSCGRWNFLLCCPRWRLCCSVRVVAGGRNFCMKLLTSSMCSAWFSRSSIRPLVVIKPAGGGEKAQTWG